MHGALTATEVVRPCKRSVWVDGIGYSVLAGSVPVLHTRMTLILAAVGLATYALTDALTYWWLPDLIHRTVCAVLPLFGLSGTTC